MPERKEELIRYNQPWPFWLVLLGIAGVFFLFEAYTLYSVLTRALTHGGTREIFVHFNHELVWSLLYAFTTTILQMVLGITLAVMAYHYFGHRGGFSSLIYLFLLPYFIPIAPLAFSLKQWVFDRVDLTDGLKWLVLIALSVWQFFPFVFILVYEELRTTNPRTWAALQAEGAGFKEAFRYLMWPKIMEVSGFIFLLRLLWMYTKVDTIYFLFGDGRFPSKFIHFKVFYSVQQQGESPDPESYVRAAVMILASVLLVGGGTLLQTIFSRVSRAFVATTGYLGQMFKSMPAVVSSTLSRRVHFPPSLAGAACLILFLLLVVLPIVWQISLSVFPTNQVVTVGSQDLISAWEKCLSYAAFSEGMPRWIFQSIVLATFTSLFYTLAMWLLSYSLLRESRLQRWGQEQTLRWVPAVAYTVPIIALALPATHLSNHVPCRDQVCIYLKLLLMHGLYLWPFCLWLSFGIQLKSLRHRSEIAAIAEEARLFDVLWLSVIPQVWHRLVAVFLLGFAISFNELIFAACLINNEKYYTIPKGIASLLSATLESGTASELFVTTTIAIFVSILITWGMARAVRVAAAPR